MVGVLGGPRRGPPALSESCAFQLLRFKPISVGNKTSFVLGLKNVRSYGGFPYLRSRTSISAFLILVVDQSVLSH